MSASFSSWLVLSTLSGCGRGALASVDKTGLWEVCNFQFVVDTMICCRDMVDEALNLRFILLIFEMATGLAINLIETSLILGRAMCQVTPSYMN